MLNIAFAIKADAVVRGVSKHAYIICNLTAFANHNFIKTINVIKVPYKNIVANGYIFLIRDVRDIANACIRIIFAWCFRGIAHYFRFKAS